MLKNGFLPGVYIIMKKNLIKLLFTTVTLFSLQAYPVQHLYAKPLQGISGKDIYFINDFKDTLDEFSEDLWPKRSPNKITDHLSFHVALGDNPLSPKNTATINNHSFKVTLSCKLNEVFNYLDENNLFEPLLSNPKIHSFFEEYTNKNSWKVGLMSLIGKMFNSSNIKEVEKTFHNNPAYIEGYRKIADWFGGRITVNIIINDTDKFFTTYGDDENRIIGFGTLANFIASNFSPEDNDQESSQKICLNPASTALNPIVDINMIMN